MTRLAILHYAAPPIIGGVESTIHHHARLLARDGFGVDVIAGRGGDFHPNVQFHLLPEIDSRHPDVLATGQELAAGQVSPKFNALRDRLVERLLPILTADSLCIVHNAVTLHKNLALSAALYRLSQEHRIPLIAWCHDFAWQDPLYIPSLHPGYPWDLLRKLWPAVRYVVVSEPRRLRLAELLEVPQDSIRVIPPGVDLFEFLQVSPHTQALVERLKLMDGNPLLLLPARITRRKNIEFAIQVTAALKQHTPHPLLVVTGPPGPHNPKNEAYLAFLKELRRKLAADDHVLFLFEAGVAGQALAVPDEVVAGLYRLADLLLFPSWREGFGIPVLEAGLSRLPVFAADIPSVRKSAGDLGHLFDPDCSPDQVASLIVRFLESDRAYRLRRKVLDHYTWQSIYQQKILPLLAETFGLHNPALPG